MSTTVPSNFVYNASYVFQATSDSASAAETLVSNMTKLSQSYYQAKVDILQNIREKLIGLASGENNRVQYKVLFLSDLVEKNPPQTLNFMASIYSKWKVSDILSDLGITITTKYSPGGIEAKRNPTSLTDSFLQSDFNDPSFSHYNNQYMNSTELGTLTIQENVCFFMHDIFKDFTESGQTVQQLLDDAISKVRESVTQQQNAASRIQTFWDQSHAIQEKIYSASSSVFRR